MEMTHDERLVQTSLDVIHISSYREIEGLATGVNHTILIRSCMGHYMLVEYSTQDEAGSCA